MRRSKQQGVEKAKVKLSSRASSARRSVQGRPPVNWNKPGQSFDLVMPMVTAPASKTRPIRSSQPREVRLPNGNRALIFKEYVQDIAGSVAFAAVTFPVQPGISTLFAWLAEQAGLYQEYQFRRLRFCYETEKSSATSGKVIFVFSPDATDAAPAGKQEALEYKYKGGNAPWSPFVLEVPTSEALGARRYVRTGTLAANQDIKTTDLGSLFVCTQGMADTTAVGELYVEYSIELITPVLNAQARATSISASIVAVAPDATSVYGATPTITGGLDVTAAVNTLTFNRVGRYQVRWSVTGTGLFTSFAPTLTGTATAGTPSGISNAAANAGTSGIAVVNVIVTSRGQTLISDFDPVSTTITAATAAVSVFNVA